MQWAKKCPNRSKNNSTNLVDVSDEEDGFKNVQIILMRRASSGKIISAKIIPGKIGDIEFKLC